MNVIKQVPTGGYKRNKPAHHTQMWCSSRRVARHKVKASKRRIITCYTKLLSEEARATR